MVVVAKPFDTQSFSIKENIISKDILLIRKEQMEGCGHFNQNVPARSGRLLGISFRMTFFIFMCQTDSALVDFPFQNAGLNLWDIKSYYEK